MPKSSKSPKPAPQLEELERAAGEPTPAQLETVKGGAMAITYTVTTRGGKTAAQQLLASEAAAAK